MYFSVFDGNRCLCGDKGELDPVTRKTEIRKGLGIQIT